MSFYQKYHLKKIFKELDLSDNQLPVVDSRVFTPLISLRSLRLAGNKLAGFLPAGLPFPPLGSLRVLDLGGNRLAQVPAAAGIFGALPALTELILAGNLISEVTTMFSICLK